MHSRCSSSPTSTPSSNYATAAAATWPKEGSTSLLLFFSVHFSAVSASFMIPLPENCASFLFLFLPQLRIRIMDFRTPPLRPSLQTGDEREEDEGVALSPSLASNSRTEKRRKRERGGFGTKREREFSPPSFLPSFLLFPRLPLCFPAPPSSPRAGESVLSVFRGEGRKEGRGV